MKTTLELPDELMRAIKVRAAQENRKLKHVVADLLRKGLSAEAPKSVGRRVKLPLFHVPHSAKPEEELTPERISDILLEEEARWATQQ